MVDLDLGGILFGENDLGARVGVCEATGDDDAFICFLRFVCPVGDVG